MRLWLEFIICSGVIVICGSKLSRYGDIIAEKTGLGRAWIGLLLMAAITSLPELVTGISSVTIAGLPDITAGDILGSCVYNLAILALIDFMNGSKPLLRGASPSHSHSASIGIALTGVALISITAGGAFPSIAHIGLYTPLIFIIYLFGLRSIYIHEKGYLVECGKETSTILQYDDISMKRAVLLYLINAIIIVSAAVFLPVIAGGIAKTTGLGDTFMGSIFVAMTTSLPELVVSISAVRIGADDMAIGNMLGSNMFNITILAVDDIFYTAGPIFSHVSESHVTTGLIAIVMTSVVLFSLSSPTGARKFMRLGWDTSLLGLMWIANIYILYLHI